MCKAWSFHCVAPAFYSDKSSPEAAEYLSDQNQKLQYIILQVIAEFVWGFDFFFFTSIGAIFIIESLDYESSHEYYLTVEATDGGTPSLSDVVTVNINVTDINDNTPVFSQDTYTAVISEDAILEQSVITVRIVGVFFSFEILCHDNRSF